MGADRTLDRRTFITELGRGAFALTVFSVIGCAPAATASLAPLSSPTAGASAATPAPTVSPTGTPSTATSSPAGSPSASPAASVATNRLEITAREYAFEMPATAPAGLTTIALKNTGAEEHQAQSAKLNENVTLPQLQAALQNPDPSAALGMVVLTGGPTGIAPGATGVTTSNLAPGNYVFLCFVPAPDGLPHIAKGMVAALQVTGSASTAQVPTAANVVTTKDFSFEVPTTPLKAGKATFTLDNKGPQPHEATLVKLATGVTVDQLKQMFSATPAPTGPAGSPAASPGGSPASGAPPWTSAGGIAGISANTKANFDVDLTAGNYAFLCFIPDPASGRDHASLGMVAGVTVQ